MRSLLLAPVLLLAACQTEPGSALGVPDAGPQGTADAGASLDAGASADAGPLTCEGLDEAACALSNCRSKACLDCEGDPLFTQCFGEVEPSCPDLLCPPACSTLSQAECAAAGERCRVDICPGCRDDGFFAGCADPTTQPLPCPPVLCPPCEDLPEADCRQDFGCHRVFGQVVEECWCDGLGCCHEFTGCREGAQADCRGENLACRRVAPFCEGPYVISYEGTCYEGCVLAEDC